MGTFCPCGHASYGYTLDPATKTMRKKVEGTVHMLLKPSRAWAIQAEVFEYHQQQGDVETWIVEDVQTGTVYTVTAAFFLEHCSPIERGSGEQYALPLIYWQYSRGEVLQPRLL